MSSLDSVPPHRRDLVQRRIAAIARHLANPRNYTAETAAKDSGLAVITFRRLARVWTATADPRRLMGRGSRDGSPSLPSEQADVINAAVQEMGDVLLERIAERAMEIAHDRHVRMPGQAAVIKHIALATTGTIPSELPAATADLVLEHVVVDIPLADRMSGKGLMPLVTVVTSVAHAQVVGLSLCMDSPTPDNAAEALFDAANNICGRADAEASGTIYAQLLEGSGWDELASKLRDAGMTLIEHRRPEPSPPVATLRLLGRRPGTVKLKPRLGRRPLIARPARIPVGAEPFTMEEATSYLRARWMPRLPLPIDISPSVVRALRASFR